MSTRLVGRPVRRSEDPELLTGRARFIDDVRPPGAVHLHVVRARQAHGRLLGVDASGARTMPGVVGAFTAADLGRLGDPLPVVVPPPPIAGLVFNAATNRPLAVDRVRYVGEPVAVVVAESRYLAEDAAERVRIEIDPLPAVVDLEAALDPDASVLHESIGSNLAAHAKQRKGAPEALARAFAEAGTVVRRRFRYDRGASAALENRGVVARWEGGELTVWDTTQAPIPVRGTLAARLGLMESQVRVIAPFIGGGFGPKIMLYPEELIVPWVAMKLGRPVKWIEDRYENFLATTQEREQIHDAELALDSGGRILAVRDTFVHDTGAYDPYGLTVPINSQCTLLGPYRVPLYESEFRVVFTNRTIVTPVRGAGRQHGVFVMERLLDLGSRELGLDPVEIRRRNLLTPDEFPHDHGILFQDSAPLTYDSGSYAESLEQAVERVGYESFRKERPQPMVSGGSSDTRRRGIGVVCYVEGTGIGPYEGVRVSIEPSGRVRVSTGVGSQGQGHFTSFAQVVAEQLGVGVADVVVSTGDTAHFGWGSGTFASRGAVVVGNACHAAGLSVRRKVLGLAGSLLEVAEEDLVLESGRVSVVGAPDLGFDLGDLAVRANPLRGAVRPGTEPGLEATAYFGPSGGTTANGVHAAIVEVDLETARVAVVRYVVVHDCGTVINPMIVEGQIHGGVAHGIGNALFEQIQHDADGQPLTASFMDYLLPTASEVPSIEVGHTETPSPLNPMGIKGVGEAGAIPVGAVVAQAIEDAVSGSGLEILEMPLGPSRLFELLSEVGLTRTGGGRGAGGPSP